MNTRYVPCVGPDGTHYESYAHAARALGLAKSTLTHHMRTYGNLDRLEVKGIRCQWRGQNYPSLVAAAAAAGMHRQSAYYHMRKHGNLDNMGSGCGPKPKTAVKPKSIMIGSLVFESLHDASVALRMPLEQLRAAMASGASEELKRTLRVNAKAYITQSQCRA